MEVQKEINDGLDRIESYIIRLNIDSPIDRWWRKKHNVAFNSAEHRAITIIDQYAEWYEEHLLKESEERVKEVNGDPYMGEGDFLLAKEETEHDRTLSDEEFDNISLDDI